MILRDLGCLDYPDALARMVVFTAARGAGTPDEVWLVGHPPVFTLGQSGRTEHVLAAGDIPVVQSDRGGQVTYHGPGQVVAYVLLDLRRLGLDIRGLVTALEDAAIRALAAYGIRAAGRRDAPGVYVDGAKIASLGLRVRRGCSYHGLALNVAMDLAPFTRINPCGFRGLAVTQVADLGGPADVARVAADLGRELLAGLGTR